MNMIPPNPALDPVSIAFTIGDVNGVGPEVLLDVLRTLRPSAETAPSVLPTVVANARLLEQSARELGATEIAVDADSIAVDGWRVPLVEIESDALLHPGTTDSAAGRLAGDAVTRATTMALDGVVDAVVTMPIAKSSLNSSGYRFAGHTEMIASLTGGIPLMILTAEAMRVALTTIHHPLRSVPDLITRELVEERIAAFDRSLRRDFAIDSPRIAVLGLNPHAGEDGLLGTEEIEIISPAIDDARNAGLDAAGPFPADGFFARFIPNEYHGVLAMYHDQGLGPLKLYAHGGGVNVTANLRIVRTSPDHGTAFSIAAKGRANPNSAIEATRLAAVIARNRAAD